MQTSLVILLMLCVCLSVQGYYFGFVRPPSALAWLQKSTFLVSSFLLIPFLIAVLLSQSGAKKRLERSGFQPHPAIKECVGFGNGIGSHPTWVFKVTAEKDQIKEFYKSRDNTGGWSLETDDDFLMIFAQEERRMTVAYRKGWNSRTLTFILSEN